jgi:hypothetical protein
MRTDGHRKRATLLDATLLVTVAFVSLLASGYLVLKPRDPASGVAAFFAPWSNTETTFLRSVEAGTRFIRFGGFPFIAVVMPEDADAYARLRAAGAWFIADPKALAACLNAAGRNSI